MSIISGWTGTLKQLKIGPEAGGEATGGSYGTFSINYIRLFKDPVTEPVLSPGNTTYYISQSGGNDNNNGTSQATPWKTIAKLNSIKFAPGDAILFKRGDIWSDECWYPKGNGNYSLCQWITVDAYGTGNKPQFRAGSKFATVYFEPDTFTGGWKFLNLDIRDAKQGILCNNPNPNSIHGTKYNTPYTPASGLWVENCSFSNITGAQVYAPGAMVNLEYDECQFYASQPILFKYANNVTIKNCTISHCDTPFQTWGDNINVDGVKVDNIYINGVFFMSCSNSVIQNSSFLYMSTTGAFTGTAAIMFEDCTNCQVKNTEIGYTQNSDIYPFDAIAIDFEANNINCKASGCYLHDNEGPAFLIMDHDGEPTYNDQRGIVIEDCVSVNNGARRTSSHDVSFINLYHNETHKIEVRNCIDIRPAGVFALNHDGSKGNAFPTEHYTVSNVTLETSSSLLKPMKKAGGSWSTLAAVSVPSIRINQWNHITILATGPRVKTYVNGILVNILLDTSFSSGSIGMRESGSESAVFDNIYMNSIAKEWEFSMTAEGWTAGNQIAGFGWHTGGYIEGTVTGGDPYFYSPDNLGIAVSDHQQIRIRLQNGTPCTDLQLFFITDSDPVWNGDKMTTVKILPSSDYTEYLIDMSDVAGWTGTLKQLRIDPNWGQTAGGFSIDYITI